MLPPQGPLDVPDAHLRRDVEVVAHGYNGLLEDGIVESLRPCCPRKLRHALLHDAVRHHDVVRVNMRLGSSALEILLGSLMPKDV